MASFEKTGGFVLPKNIVQATLFALGVVVVSLLVRYGNYSSTDTYYRETEVRPVRKESVETILEKDSDSDGLKDWEEALWGTNPESKDSDGDGKNDKIFIDEKREALIENGSINKSFLATTTTDILSRQIFATLISLQQTNSLNEKTIDSLTEAFANSIEEGDNLPSISSDRISLVPITPETKKTYAGKIKSAVSPYQYSGLGKELASFGKAMQSGNTKDLTPLKTNARVYRELAQKFLTIPTPYDIAEAHLLLVKNYLLMSKSLEDMGKIFTDPVVALFGISLYEQASSNALLQMHNIELYIK